MVCSSQLLDIFNFLLFKTGALYLICCNLTIRLFRVISRTLAGGVLPICWDAVRVFYSPADCAEIVWCHIKDTYRGALLLCRESVDVFYSPSRLGHQATRLGSLTPLQLVYPANHPTGPQNTRWGTLTPVQRSSRCIPLAQPTGQIPLVSTTKL